MTAKKKAGLPKGVEAGLPNFTRLGGPGDYGQSFYLIFVIDILNDNDS